MNLTNVASFATLGKLLFLAVFLQKPKTAKKSNLPRVAKLATFVKFMLEVYKIQINNKIPLILFGQVGLLTPGLSKAFSCRRDQRLFLVGLKVKKKQEIRHRFQIQYLKNGSLDHLGV